MLRIFYTCALAASCLLLCAGSALAHHSYQAEFDQTKCTNITGILTKVDWDNPHIYFYMTAKDAGGKVTAWTFEGHSLPALQRNGTQGGFHGQYWQSAERTGVFGQERRTQGRCRDNYDTGWTCPCSRSERGTWTSSSR